MQEELRQVLMIYREKKQNDKDGLSPKVFLDRFSTPREVQNWLTTKKFSERYEELNCNVTLQKAQFPLRKYF